MKKAYLSAAALVIVALAIVMSGGAQARPATGGQSGKYEVKIDNFRFSPASLKVRVGTTVRWTNHDAMPHNIVSAEGKTFKSPVLDTDQGFSFTFSKAGEYPYYCGIHPTMTGKVVVQ